MSDPNLIRDLATAGIDPELLQRVVLELARGQAAIAAAEKAEAEQKARAEAALAAKRAANAERQRRFRDKNNAGHALQHVTNRDVTLRHVTEQAAPNDPAPLPPHTPPITPTPNTHSDPVGSGSPSVEPTAPAEVDPRKDLFDRGVPALRRMTGRADPGCRALLGKWLGLAQDSAVIVMTAVDAAVEGELASPIPWIEKTIRNEVQRNGTGSHDLFRQPAASRGGRGGSSFDAVAAGLARVADRRGLRPGGRQNGSGYGNGSDHEARRDDTEIEDADWRPAGGYRAAYQ